MQIIQKYFPDLTQNQYNQFQQLLPAYTEWNSKINVISRKDIEMLYERHILHSLAIAKIIQFKNETKIVDVGTGGGFPGIPLAILFPETSFFLIDSIGKKIKVVEEVAAMVGLKNISAKQIRSNELKEQFDFVISRAVTAFPDFVKSTAHLISKKNKNIIPNGILYLKGGDFDEEIKPLKNKIKLYSISDFFGEEFFETKKIIYLGG